MIPPPPDAPPPLERRRLIALGCGIGGALLFLLSAIGYWQLARSRDVIAREQKQSLRVVAVPAARGALYDRRHRLLAGPRVRTSVVVDPGALREEFLREQNTRFERIDPAEANGLTRRLVVTRHLDRLNAVLGRTTPLDEAALAQTWTHAAINPLVLAADLTADELARFERAAATLAPLRLERRETRTYPQGRLAAHALGRVRRETLAPDDKGGLVVAEATQEAGDFGIEKALDERLRGRPGQRTLRVDATGFVIGVAEETRAPVAGDAVELSLDADLQRATEAALAAVAGSPRGAAVALDVRTGEVLALASRPDFDPNAISPTINPATKQRLDQEGAWLNRATQALYPPGSTFKIFTALAALRAGKLSPDERLTCTGALLVGGRRFACHQPAGHGALTLADALAHSCNVYAYQIGLRCGPDALAAEARRFHLDAPTGIELPAETHRMLVPDPAWKLREGRGAWTDSDTANLAIGQGFVRISPLQLACAVASLARGECLTVPTLLHHPGRSPTGDRLAERLDVPDAARAALIAGLEQVVMTGIGSEAQVPGVRVAGKSGTAQVAGADGPRNVAWFVAFAPVDRPAIAVAVALEGTKTGSEFAGAEHAAPVAREMLAAYFERTALAEP